MKNEFIMTPKKRVFFISIMFVLMMALFLLFSKNTSAQNFGIGLRFGDPTAISAKKYMGSNALELNIGRSFRWGWDYKKRFYDYDDGWGGYEYEGHTLRSPITIQLHYLINKDIKDAEGLNWYFGFGGQVRVAKIIYNYKYKYIWGPDPDDDWYWVYNTETATELDVGADGVIGLEYTFENAPISIFGDINLMIEVFDNPFFFWFQGGIGARYNF